MPIMPIMPPLRTDDLRPGLTIRFPSGRVFRIIENNMNWLTLVQIEGPPSAESPPPLMHVADVVKRGAAKVADAPAEGEGK